MVKKTTLLICMVLLGFVFLTDAQNYIVEDYLTLKTKSVGAELIGIDEEGLIYTKSKKKMFSPMSIKIINPSDGSLVVDKPLNFPKLTKKGYVIKDVVFKDKTLYLVVRNIKDNWSWSFVKLDKNLNIVGGVMRICENIMVYREHKYIKADDGINYFITYKISDKGHALFSVKGFDDDSNKSSELDFQLENTQSISNLRILSVDKDKFFAYCIYSTREKVADKILVKTHNILFSINSKGEMKKFDLDFDKKMSISDMRIIKDDGKLRLLGNLVDLPDKNLIAFFSAELDYDTYELSEIDIYEFDDPSLIIKDPGARKNNILKELIELEDGGYIYFSQVYEFSVAHKGDGSAVFYYHYEDLHIAKVNSNGDLEWINHLPIKLVSEKVDPEIGFSPFFDGKNLYIMHSPIYNKGKKNDSNIAISKISESGKLITENIIDDNTKKIKYTPKSVSKMQKGNKVFLVDNLKRKVISIVTISLN